LGILTIKKCENLTAFNWIFVKIFLYSGLF